MRTNLFAYAAQNLPQRTINKSLILNRELRMLLPLHGFRITRSKALQPCDRCTPIVIDIPKAMCHQRVDRRF